jgi:hypothetical protein
MSLRDSMREWLDKQTPGTSEWIPVCERLTNDEGLRIGCINFASEYEAHRMDELNLLTNLSNLTGKNIDDIELILAEVSNAEKAKDATDNPGYQSGNQQLGDIRQDE